jgi:isopenicillin-N N-acyltransferase-like protein
VILTFSGPPGELGRQHGEELRDAIAHVLGWYTEQWWGMTARQVQDFVRDHARAVHTHAPHLAAEIEGIAQGAGQPAWAIHALNARTELRADTHALECTSAALSPAASDRPGALLAQNWDWWSTLRGHTRVARLEPESGPEILTLIEPGMVAKIGVNAHGVGLCLNFLSTPRVDLGGLPVHVLCRLILESRSFEQARAFVARARRAAGAIYMVGDASGAAGALETSPGESRTHRADDLVSATNLPADAFCMRRAIFGRRLRMYASPLTGEDLLDALGHPGVVAPPDEELAVETIHALVIDTRARSLTITDGCRAPQDADLGARVWYL